MIGDAMFTKNGLSLISTYYELRQFNQFPEKVENAVRELYNTGDYDNLIMAIEIMKGYKNELL